LYQGHGRREEQWFPEVLRLGPGCWHPCGDGGGQRRAAEGSGRCRVARPATRRARRRAGGRHLAADARARRSSRWTRSGCFQDEDQQQEQDHGEQGCGHPDPAGARPLDDVLVRRLARRDLASGFSCVRAGWPGSRGGGCDASTALLTRYIAFALSGRPGSSPSGQCAGMANRAPGDGTDGRQPGTRARAA
jgi:hypothetical protein